MAVAPGREAINLHIKNKPKLVAIVDYHHAKGREHMSQTQALEALIEREHKRLKL